MNTRLAYTLSLVFWITLIALTVLWEGWLAPSPPIGFWLTIKSLPLLIPLFGMLHMKRRSFSVAGLIAMLYFIEGVMISWGEFATGTQNSALLALSLAEVLLVLAFVVCIYIYLRNTKYLS
ncbi:MAG: DUF2069 domain-containing protein [Gammaproteobacteria bacterium]|nr:DUF2069 domain-containing protein [Gammaproteobacteria bacterium]